MRTRSPHRIPWVSLLLGALVLSACAGGDGAREVTTSSEEAYRQYEEGVASISRFRLEKAQDSFRKAVELDPDFAMAWIRLGITARELGDRNRTETAVDRAYALRDRVTELERLWIERTHALVHGDKEKAKEIYAQLVDRYGDHPWVLRLRAEMAKLDDRNEEALALYRRILEQDPEAVDVHNLEGYLYLSTGQYGEAVKALQRYAYYAPEQANPHDSLGEAYLYTGQYEEAISEFLQALEIDPTFLWSAMHLADALSVTGQFRRAHEVLDRYEEMFAERNWQQFWAMAAMRTEFLAEKWDALLTESERQIASLEADKMRGEFGLWCHYVRTIAQLELGRLDEAHASLDQLAAVAESFRKEMSEYARIEDIMRLNEAFVKARFHRAEGDPLGGVEELRAAIAASSRPPHELSMFRYELAEDLLEANDPAAAIDAVAPALQAIPTLPMMNLIAARAYRDLDQRDTSLAHLQTYLQVMRLADDDHPRVAQARELLSQLVPRS